MSDNATAYINKQGGSRCMHCNSLSVEIWRICISHNTFISASHIPGNHNVIADAASRKFRDVAEWMFDLKVFCTLCNTFGICLKCLRLDSTNNLRDMCHGHQTQDL